MRSIERTLLSWVIGALSTGALLVALAAYLATLDEMNEIFDADLGNVADAVANIRPSGTELPAGASPVLSLVTPAEIPDDSEIATLLWSRQGRLLYSSDPRVELPFSNVEGLAQRHAGIEDWVVYTSVRPDGVAQAAQRVSSREEMAGESTARVLLPLLLLFMLIGVVMVFGLRRGLRPLDRTASDVAARSARTLDPIATADVPRELVPLVTSVNGLMQRLSEAFSAQRLFVADAAHELRTPVTALRLQLQLLRRARDEAARRNAMAALEAGVDRAQQLIEKLLQVARAEHHGETSRCEPVDLGALARSVVTRMAAVAEQRRLDLGVAEADDRADRVPVLVQGDLEQLTVLLNNLVENALRYTPAGGVIDVVASVENGLPALRVIDTGPGIPAAERERVFNRFCRGENAQREPRAAGGSGLGLAIVRAIAERHQAHVSLHDARSGSGLEVRVIFPVSPA